MMVIKNFQKLPLIFRARVDFALEKLKLENIFDVALLSCGE